MDFNLAHGQTVEEKLDSILYALTKFSITFSKSEAVKIVGGTPRLNRLVERGHLKVRRQSESSNAKCFFDAADVLKWALV